MTVRVVRRSSYDLDEKAIRRAVSAFVPEHVRDRLAKNLDVRDRPFRRLDDDTKRRRAREGDLSRQILGGEPFEVREQRHRFDRTRLTIEFGAATAALRRIGKYHQDGGKNLPRRAWLGISPDGLRDLRRILGRVSWKTVRGRR